MKLFLPICNIIYTSCSSQEEHVLKLLGTWATREGEMLLLARGACIETGDWILDLIRRQLLLARGACIETVYSVNKKLYYCCSSQEEHVLKLEK